MTNKLKNVTKTEQNHMVLYDGLKCLNREKWTKKHNANVGEKT